MKPIRMKRNSRVLPALLLAGLLLTASLLAGCSQAGGAIFREPPRASASLQAESAQRLLEEELQAAETPGEALPS